VWQSPDLIFAQTCGMPYRARLHGAVQIVGTPVYDLPDCPPGHYFSVFLARRGDSRTLAQLTDGIFAYNEGLSQSGWAAPVTHLSDMGLAAGRLLETGGHLQSAQAVADGRADFASLDALTWALLKEHSDLGDQIGTIATTVPTPALPYITALGRDANRIAEAVTAAIADLSQEDRRALHLKDLATIPPEQYLRIPTPPPPHTSENKKDRCNGTNPTASIRS